MNGNSESFGNPTEACAGLAKHRGFSTRYDFLKAHRLCHSRGFIDYLAFFYRDCKKFPFLGFAMLGLWLAALFYMLGNSAADYFCCNLEKLSSLLKLPATVAGVTLLPLRNGASDVFASIASFVGTGTGEVGLNSVYQVVSLRYLHGCRDCFAVSQRRMFRLIGKRLHPGY